MTLTISRQIKAGRALLAWEQTDLCSASGVSISTIRRIEGMDGPLRGTYETVHKIQVAMEGAGIEFLNHGAPGVRMRVGSDQSG